MEQDLFCSGRCDSLGLSSLYSSLPCPFVLLPVNIDRRQKECLPGLVPNVAITIIGVVNKDDAISMPAGKDSASHAAEEHTGMSGNMFGGHRLSLFGNVTGKVNFR